MILALATAALAAEVHDLSDLVEAAWTTHPERLVLDARLAAEATVRERPRETQLRPSFDDVASRIERMRTTLAVRQPLEPPGSLRLADRALVASLDVERLELRLLELEVRASITEAWDDTRLGQAEVALLDQEIALQEKRVEITRLRLDAGLPEAKQVLDAELDLAEARQRRAAIGFQVAESLAELERLTGLPDLSVSQSSLVAELEAPLPEVDPTPSMQGARIAAAEAELAAERAARRPFVDWVQAEVEKRPAEAWAFGFGASIEVPVWRFRDGEVRAAEGKLQAVRREVDHERERRVAEVGRARALFVAARGAYTASAAAAQRAHEAVTALDAELTPDVRMEVGADLLGLDRRALDGLRSALEARRRVEGAMLAAGDGG